MHGLLIPSPYIFFSYLLLELSLHIILYMGQGDLLRHCCARPPDGHLVHHRYYIVLLPPLDVVFFLLVFSNPLPSHSLLSMHPRMSTYTRLETIGVSSLSWPTHTCGACML
jgi:hypothetical protein